MYTELMKACLRAAEADAKSDEWGVMCPAQLPIEITRNLFVTAYPEMVEILQLLGSSSFMMRPSEADFHTSGSRDRTIPCHRHGHSTRACQTLSSCLGYCL